VSNRLPAWFEFLRIEADLAITFIDTAKASSILENSNRSLGNARKALEQIRHALANPIGLVTEETEFLEQCCVEIEAALLAFRPGTHQ
jgi:hypothetical protein